jgi:hypothetical protein
MDSLSALYPLEDKLAKINTLIPKAAAGDLVGWEETTAWVGIKLLRLPNALPGLMIPRRSHEGVYGKKWWEGIQGNIWKIKWDCETNFSKGFEAGFNKRGGQPIPRAEILDYARFENYNSRAW